jgi:hypothetical protein
MPFLTGIKWGMRKKKNLCEGKVVDGIQREVEKNNFKVI